MHRTLRMFFLFHAAMSTTIEYSINLFFISFYHHPWMLNSIFIGLTGQKGREGGSSENTFFIYGQKLI